jgi:hypothetical protein
VSREVHDDAIGRLCDRWEPFLQLSTDVGERRLLAFEEVDVLGREGSTFAIDQDAVHRVGVAFGELKLLGRLEVLVLRNPDHDGVAARHAGSSESGGWLWFLEDEVSASRVLRPTWRHLRLREGEDREQERRDPQHRLY